MVAVAAVYSAAVPSGGVVVARGAATGSSVEGRGLGGRGLRGRGRARVRLGGRRVEEAHLGRGEDAGRLVLEVDAHALAQDVDVADAAHALGRRDALAGARQHLGGLDVVGVLVDEAALEAAALARDLRRVEREVLILRHLDRDGRELRQERRAAELAPARADAAHHLGLVAHAHLAHLDARVNAAREVAHEVAEIDALLGREVERRAVAATVQLDAEHLDGQVSGLGALAREGERVGGAPALGLEAREVARVGDAQDARQGRGRGAQRGRHGHRRDGGALVVDDDAVAGAQRELAGVARERPARGRELHADDVDDGRRRDGARVRRGGVRAVSGGTLRAHAALPDGRAAPQLDEQPLERERRVDVREQRRVRLDDGGERAQEARRRERRELARAVGEERELGRPRRRDERVAIEAREQRDERRQRALVLLVARERRGRVEGRRHARRRGGRAQQRDGVPLRRRSDLFALGARRLEHARRRAVGERDRDARAVGLDAVRGRDAEERLLGERAEPKPLRARPDRRQQPVGRARAQHDVVARRRLLERLEQAVGGARVQRVGVVDDDDARRGLVRPRLRERDDGLGLVDDELGPVGREGRHVGVQAGLDAAARLADAAAAPRRLRAREREREAERRGALADAGRPLEEVGVRHVRGLHGAREAVRDAFLADDVLEPHHGTVARPRDAGLASALGRD